MRIRMDGGHGFSSNTDLGKRIGIRREIIGYDVPGVKYV